VIRALIVDDESPARDKLRRWLSTQADFDVVGEADDGLRAAEAIESLRPDAVFLDIQMPGLSGLEVAAQLEAASAPMLVFATAYDEHAIKAFELNAIDYLLKPYDRSRFDKTLERLRSRRHGDGTQADAIRAARARIGNTDRLLVSRGDELRLIDSARILWLEADDNYVHVHTDDARYLLRRTLGDLIAQLGEQRFARIHKSCAVNLSQVASLVPLFKGDYEVRLRGGQTLRLSRRFKDALFGRMGR
jgi:two-component system, LytTR family, response regulator